jgi:hypothetical protein
LKFLIEETVPCFVTYRCTIEAESEEHAHALFAEGERGDGEKTLFGDVIEGIPVELTLTKVERAMTHAFDNTRAFGEGWGVFLSDDGLLRIKRRNDPQSATLEDAPVFRSDDEAIIWVAEQGRTGSAYHARACALHGTTGGGVAP